MDVRADFLSAVRAAGCLQHGDSVVLGVSGGADSLAMLHLFASAPELGLRPHVLHLNHKIRGATAQADAEFVAATCREWNIPCHVAEADVPALARSDRLTIEDAARRARYQALIDEAKQVDAKVIAVAHNADDQAETVLMHFLRGSGLAGLRGMRLLTPLHFLSASADLMILRPLLDIPRSGIETYCADNHLTPRIDETNHDTAYFRNRIRREVMPLLESIAPGLGRRLRQTASIADADTRQISDDLDAVWDSLLVSRTNTRIMLDLSGWRALATSLQRAAIRRAISVLRSGLEGIGFVHVEDVLKAAQHANVGAMLNLPGGLTIQVGYDALIFTSPGDHPPEPDWPLLRPDEELDLTAPGDIELGSGWRLTLTAYDGPRSGPAWDSLIVDPWTAVLHLPDLSDLHLRPRRSGDRFHPQGMPAEKKLTDFMLDAKIPAQWRDRIPLLVSGGRIAWLCGWRVDQGSIVTPDTKNIWLAKFEKI